MTEKNSDTVENSSRIVAWYGKYGNFIPRDVQDVHLEITSDFVPVDARRRREFEIIVITFGSVFRQKIRLDETEQEWKLTTPFGNLTFAKGEFSSCNLIDDEENLVFTHKSANPKLYTLPSRNQ